MKFDVKFDMLAREEKRKPLAAIDTIPEVLDSEFIKLSQVPHTLP